MCSTHATFKTGKIGREVLEREEDAGVLELFDGKVAARGLVSSKERRLKTRNELIGTSMRPPSIARSIDLH
jgi:hypothetical protein